MENPCLVAVGGAGEGLEAVERDRGNEAIAGVGERDVAGHLGADGLGEVVVEDQPVEIAGKIFHGAGGVGVGRKILAALGDHIDSALVDELIADRAGEMVDGRCCAGASRDRIPNLLFHAAVEQCIPAHDQVVESAPLVAEVAVGRPAALAEELRADHHVHAAVDDPVDCSPTMKPLMDELLSTGIRNPLSRPVSSIGWRR